MRNAYLDIVSAKSFTPHFFN